MNNLQQRGSHGVTDFKILLHCQLNPEECDARNDATCTAAGTKIFTSNRLGIIAGPTAAGRFYTTKSAE